MKLLKKKDDDILTNVVSEAGVDEISLYVDHAFRKGAGLNCAQIVAGYFAEKMEWMLRQYVKQHADSAPE